VQVAASANSPRFAPAHLTAAFKPKADFERTLPGAALLTDAVEKRFEGSERATSIQKMRRARNIDSNNHLPGFDSCALCVCRRVFQQHRPKAVMR
jgi:hypothetical protein